MGRQRRVHRPLHAGRLVRRIGNSFVNHFTLSADAAFESRHQFARVYHVTRGARITLMPALRGAGLSAVFYCLIDEPLVFASVLPGELCGPGHVGIDTIHLPHPLGHRVELTNLSATIWHVQTSADVRDTGAAESDSLRQSTEFEPTLEDLDPPAYDASESSSAAPGTASRGATATLSHKRRKRG